MYCCLLFAWFHHSSLSSANKKQLMVDVNQRELRICLLSHNIFCCRFIYSYVSKYWHFCRLLFFFFYLLISRYLWLLAQWLPMMPDCLLSGCRAKVKESPSTWTRTTEDMGGENELGHWVGATYLKSSLVQDMQLSLKVVSCTSLGFRVRYQSNI